MTTNKYALLSAAALAAAAFVGQAQAAATIVINNINAAGVGFNDATPAAPIGGNSGTTLGQQRLIAFTHAANIWGATLTSSQPIVINAQFTALTCTASSATLGSAGATSVFRDFANAPKSGTWYSYALANKLSGSYLGTANAAQINARFNVNLGNTGCLDGTRWYLGLDGNHGTDIDFVVTLLHEMGHGIGFQTFTNGSTGAFLSDGVNGYPAAWDHYLTDASTGLTWAQSTASQRAASALSVDKLVWNGPIVNNEIPNVLRQGNPGLIVSGAASGASAGNYAVGEASFGPALSTTPLVGQIMPVVTSTGTLDLACNALTGNSALAVKNNIALVSRGTCGFAIKVKNAQNAGAIGVLIADNAPGAPAGMSGTDPTITIPSVRIEQATGVKLLTALAKRSRTSSGVVATLGIVGTRYSGADAQGRMMMYAPATFASGSSVSHFDTTATRNLLMEPAISGDLTHNVIPPYDLTFRLLQEIGW
ncbi:PA domain-containing protein [Paucibacter sp. APW11]|uniref:PA domain-containing protein n=1 Tax=Roseateles aquae TaxID=3077235 RepID=A0ABU3PBP4_9BURK|nr:PA domain-containing protein [Paucibacter sp. APW11]MDT8999221.1 PA domain-containing protein [Paucibacter sp. APW11]